MHAEAPEAQPIYDLAVIGGGVNGCGIARDAAGRGLKVVLFEKGDLACGTSSASTKLIHGGLRYLEHYAFRLVHEALAEREVLWAIAPHIVRPLRFVLPHREGMRPYWMLRLGLFLYDHLGGRRLLPPTKVVDLAAGPLGAPLKPGSARGFEYSDCWVDDARLVVLNARDAADHGAEIRTRERVVAARRTEGGWDIASERDGQGRAVRARVLVNAAGPWAGEVLTALGIGGTAPVRLVQGSHIVVPCLYAHDRAYIFQNADGRIVFAIPYEGAFTLIGTTDEDYAGHPEEVRASTAEVAYLCAAASAYFAAPVEPSQVVWSYSGVRSLYDDGAQKAQEATRDYVLALDAHAGAPLLSVFGGKITTYRRLAEAVLDKLSGHLPAMGGSWTGGAPLPGGDFPCEGFEALVGALADAHPALAPELLRRLARAYGTEARRLLAGVATEADLGPGFGAQLTGREVDHLMDREWAMSADDILWRRSKLGLHLPREQQAELASYVDSRLRAAQSPGN